MVEDKTPATLWQRFNRVVEEYPQRVALKYQISKVWQSFDYKTLQQKIQHVQQQLQAYHLLPGERVILFAQNTPQSVIYFFALLALQATPVLLDDQLPTQQLQTLISFSDARVIITRPSNLLEISANLLADKLIFDSKDIDNCYSLYAKTIASQPVTPFDSNIALLLYTSGTTGNYQAVCHTHKSLLASIDASINFSAISEYDRGLAFLPLFHVYPLVNNLLTALYRGAEITLLDRIDSLSMLVAMQESRPTLLTVVPRLLEVLYQQMRQRIAKQHYLADISIGLLCYAARSSQMLGWQWLNHLLTKKFKQLFGGQVRCFFVGGANLDRKIQKIVSQLVAPVYLGYGLTETAGAAITCHEGQAKIGSVGKPSNYCQLSLQQRDETGQGEICLQTLGLMQSYFRSDQPLTQDGWFHTGDLGMLDKKGFLTITGRIKELIVLPDGKKVLPGLVESYYQHIPGVAELVILGCQDEKIAAHEKVCALVVMEISKVDKTEQQQKIVQAIQKISSKLPFHYRVAETCFVNKIIKTNTLKVNRPANRAALLKAAKKKTPKLVKKNPVKNNVFDAAEKIVLQKLVSNLEETLDVSFSHSMLEQNLLQLGIDSLAFSNFYMRVMLDFPDSNISSSDIEQLKFKYLVRKIAQPTADKTDNTAWLNPKLDPTITIVTNPADASITITHPLLTGATGFLGAYLLHDLLKVTTIDVYCLVRAESVELGMQRIILNLKKYHLWQPLFESRILVILADISQPKLGLDENTYAQLAVKVDVIIHAAAWVNFLADFSALYATNVKGTEELIRFAVHSKLKPIEYVSTYSVLLSEQYSKVAPEQAALYPPDIDLGYTQSKWVSEQLLNQASLRGLPVNIYRPGNITGSTQTGEYNHNDFVTNLLVACLQLGKFIKSTLPLDLTPVNYVSRAIIYTTLQQKYDGYYHLVNPDPIKFSQVIKFFMRRKILLRAASETEWILSAFANSACVIYAYLPLLLKKGGKNILYSVFNNRKTKIETKKTRSSLEKVGIICPPSDDKLLQRYLDKFIEQYPDIKKESGDKLK